MEVLPSTAHLLADTRQEARGRGATVLRKQLGQSGVEIEREGRRHTAGDFPKPFAVARVAERSDGDALRHCATCSGGLF